MRTEQLKYFIEVVRQGSFSLAAKHIHISQPTISQAISNLENELQVKLLNRSRSGIHLTPIGESVYLKAQSIINLMEDIYDEVKSQSDPINGRLRISAIPSICNTYLSDVLLAYKKKHPSVELEIREEGTNQILQEVLENKTDIGIVSRHSNDIIDPKVEFKYLFAGTYMVYIGKNSSIPLQNPIPSNVVAKLPLLIFKGSYRQEEYVKRMLKTEDLNVLISIGYTEAAKKIISEGIAVGFFPDFTIKKDPFVKAGHIIPLEVENNELTLQFGWVKAKNKRLSRAESEFIKILIENIDS